MKIRFLTHTVYGRGGGVLTVVRNLAADLPQRHEVEIASVVRRRKHPLHPLPGGVEVRPLVSIYKGAKNPDLAHLDVRALLRQPSTLMPPNEPHYGQYSRASDLALEAYVGGLRGGALIGMQPGVNLAVARFADPSVTRVAQDHRPFQNRRGELRAAMIESPPRLDAFLTLVEADIAPYRRILGNDLRIEAMPNAVPPYDGRVSDLDAKIVIAGGQLKRSKGFDQLVAAWSLVAKVHPDWQLQIFGRGPRRDELIDQVRNAQLSGTVTLPGYSTDFANRLADSSVFVLSSRVEGYAMVVLEAMACGLPVVSFDCPTGPAAMITEGVEGHLVPDGDIPALAGRIIEMIDMGVGGRRAFGSRAVQRARSQSQPLISQRWEDLLAELAATKT